MVRTARLVAESNVYHVMARGVGHQIIFETDADRSRYLRLLNEKFPEEGVELLAWCLMDNHVHLLVFAPISSLSSAMRRVGSAYALYFNLVHGRSGHLFQGRYKSEPVTTDEHLMTVVRYIHQNPMKAGMVQGCDYKWSSYGAFLGGDIPGRSVDVMGVFGGIDRFVEFHQNSEVVAEPLEIPEIRKRLDDSDALNVARRIVGEDLENVKGMPRAKRDTALAQLKSAGLTARQIQRFTGVSLGTIARAR